VITFNNLSKEIPFKIFKKKYEESLRADQKNIEAVCISSYSNELKEVNSRFVNLKFVQNKDFIFFSNYSSPKAKEFNSHNQMTATIYWNSTDTQIRLKAHIKKSTKKFNQEYFCQRNEKKNALAISSNQSDPIKSYEEVKKNYDKSLLTKNLKKCPEYWGGFSFTPYYFEFWQGHVSRLNKRDIYKLENNSWNHIIAQP